ncbi:MAG: hypothetical protein NT127_08745 [Sphingobacteriales bacterium]|nr:hypothetical protein [Sphingobacteriales bacterium]
MSEKIKIPNLCNEDWNKMTPNDNGSFCDTCKLTVVDFTKMGDDQIKNYLLNNGHVCGRFDCTQVDTSHESTLELLNKKAKKIKFKPLRWLALLLLLLLLIPVFLYSILNNKKIDRPDNHVLMGNVASPIEKDSTKKIVDTPYRKLMGEVASPHLIDSINIKKGH